ncbi:hypothetical protein, partial [uncultured Chryseobacterium sp.]|uniref:hypothetical protein n=1 Tax=uncultured Chryseobacterium sp. TaxID=259322 RepID=UPI0025E1B35B
DPASKEYHSKSLWKEDEKYIKNVMQVYFENESSIKTTTGNPYWDYATTVNNFDESFLMVPIVEDKKVISVLKVPRHGNKIYFYYTNSTDDLVFFQALVFSKHKKALKPDTSTEVNKTVCGRQWISVWIPDNESNPDPGSGSGHWESTSIIVCKQLMDDCIGIVLPDGQCDTSGGGDGGGYDYPGGGGNQNPDPEQEDPCEKTKNKISDPKFKAKYQELNKPEMFAMDHEKGFYERLPPAGSNLPSGFPLVDGAPCTHGLDFPDNEDGVAGLMHIHNDYDCNGQPSIKIFSPKDVRTFLNIIMKQARIYTGSYTNGYSTVITSQGSYMLQYTNDTWPGSTWDKIDDWTDWYTTAYNNLIFKDQFTQANVEKVFTQFLEEKVGIDGLEVYKITENSSSKLEYNGANQPVISTPCPQ